MTFQKPKSRTRQQQLGDAAERAVAHYLEHRGYTILERNLRVGHFEIDLLARRDDLVAVVEVRFRSHASWEGPFESLHPRKRDRILSAGQALWLQRFEGDETVNRMRFDAASVVDSPESGLRVDYAEGVWTLD